MDAPCFWAGRPNLKYKNGIYTSNCYQGYKFCLPSFERPESRFCVILAHKIVKVDLLISFLQYFCCLNFCFTHYKFLPCGDFA